MALPHPPRHDDDTLPPPGCPAHGQLPRIYGPDAEASADRLYDVLRDQHGHVAPVLVPGDLPAWLVLGYRQCLEVMNDTHAFVCDSRQGSHYQRGLVPEDSPLRPITQWQPLVAFADGPAHARLRSAVNGCLETWTQRHSIRQYARHYANHLLDAVVADGRADLVTQFAEQLPALVLGDLLGIEAEDRSRLAAAVRDMTSGSATAAASNAVVLRAMEELVRRRRAVLGEDYASLLLQHPAELTEAEVVQHLRLVYVCGYEPTVGLITNMLAELLTDRSLYALLQRGQLTLPDALTSALWNHPPVRVLPTRWALHDTVLGGRQIKAGDMVVLGIAAGNADPAVRDPATAPLGNEGHLAFSAGPHACPGRNLGRAITETGIEVLRERLVNLELAEDDVRWRTGWISRRPITLPCAFVPAQPSARSVPRRPEPFVDTARVASAAVTPTGPGEATADTARPPKGGRARALLRAALWRRR